MSKEVEIGIHKVWEASFSEIEHVTNKQIAGRAKYITLRHIKTGNPIGKGYIVEGHAPIQDVVVRILLNEAIKPLDIESIKFYLRETLDILYPKTAYELEIFSFATASRL